MSILASIDTRYSHLATTTSSLSCGGSLTYANPQPGEFCLDIGSGRGNDCIRLAQSVGLSGHVYGLDIAVGMLEKALANVQDKGITNIDFLKSPLEVIPLPSNTINLVISNCTLNHALDKYAVWSEIFRVLMPGGRFVVSDIYSLEPVPQQFRDNPIFVAQCWAGAVTRDEYIQTLDKTGFLDVVILEESEPYAKGSIVVSSITIRGYKPAI